MKPPVSTPVLQDRGDHRGAGVLWSWASACPCGWRIDVATRERQQGNEGSIGREVSERPGHGCKPGTVAGQAITSGISSAALRLQRAAASTAGRSLRPSAALAVYSILQLRDRALCPQMLVPIPHSSKEDSYCSWSMASSIYSSLSHPAGPAGGDCASCRMRVMSSTLCAI